MLRLISPALATLLAFSLCHAPAAAAQERTLYQRLGGYDAIAAVTDDFVGRLISDPRFERGFAGHSTDSKNRIRQLIVDQLCMATGGPCVYIGRDMKTTHAGLGISGADWDAMVVLLTATLDKFKVPTREQGELLGALAPLRAQIVEK